MPTYEFTLVLATPEESEDDAEALYEAGCDDGTISTSGDVTRIDFEREARELREAILSAIDDVQKTKFRVARVETPAVLAVENINQELMASPFQSQSQGELSVS